MAETISEPSPLGILLADTACSFAAALFWPEHLRRRPLEAAIASSISVCLRPLIPQKQNSGAVLRIAHDLRQLFLGLFAGNVMWRTASAFQAFQRPVVPLFHLYPIFRLTLYRIAASVTLFSLPTSISVDVDMLPVLFYPCFFLQLLPPFAQGAA